MNQQKKMLLGKWIYLQTYLHIYSHSLTKNIWHKISSISLTNTWDKNSQHIVKWYQHEAHIKNIAQNVMRHSVFAVECCNNTQNKSI